MKPTLENIKYLSSIRPRPIFMRLKLPVMKSRYVSNMTRNFAILMEFDPSIHILVKSIIAIHVEAHMTTQLNILRSAKADVEIVAGIIFNPYLFC
jgi:hypothetical protein